MLDEIKKFAEKGLRIGVFPIITSKKKHEWVASVRVGDDTKLTWIQGESGCSMSAFSTPEAAYKAIIEFCQKYKPSAKKQKAK
jgi:hypothetical protein